MNHIESLEKARNFVFNIFTQGKRGYIDTLNQEIAATFINMGAVSIKSETLDAENIDHKGIHGPQKEMKVRFKCLQCGRCCKEQKGDLRASPRDIARWKGEKRQDILSKVRVFGPERGLVLGGELWFDPKTGRKEASCPFLREKKGGFACLIHSTKPAVCRKYPFTGVMVDLKGCKGLKILE